MTEPKLRTHECTGDTLADGRKIERVIRFEDRASNIENIKVVAGFIDGQWYVIPSDAAYDKRFPPRGPYAKEVAVTLLRFALT